MKLSKPTLNKIKNFATINPNLVIKPGNALSTLSIDNTTMAMAQVPETFAVSENGFGIYDLNEFLGTMSLFEDPDLEFSDKFVTITEGKSSIKYFAGDQNVMKYPTKSLTFPPELVNFKLTSAALNTIYKVSGVLKTQFVSISGDGSTITLKIADFKNATANAYSSEIGTTDKVFNVIISVNNLKLLPGDYDVSIATMGEEPNKRGISRFTANDLVYYVAIEKTSTFG